MLDCLCYCVVVLVMNVAIVTIDWLLLIFVLWFWVGCLYVNNCIGDDCVGGCYGFLLVY